MVNSFVAKILLSSCLVMTIFYLRAPESVLKENDNEFVVEKAAASSREKKYSELQEELIHEYETLLRRQVQLVAELSQAQEQCLDALKKSIENIPKMSRSRVEKEIERVKKLCESLKTAHFF